MKRRRHKVLVVMISTLFCFTSFIFPDIPAAQEKVLEKKHARIDSIIHAMGLPPDWCRHGRDKRKFFCDWGKGHGGGFHRMKVVLCTSKRQIKWGESAKLAWFCKKADTCELTPDIGPLNPNGCGIIDVSPKKTTKYTLQ